MKYFININTPEELKAEFRRLSIELHPDRNNGNDEEFKIMLNDHEQKARELSGEPVSKTSRRRSSVSFRRGMRIIWNGYGCNKTYYTIVSVNGDRLELVEIGNPCEGVEFFKYMGIERITEYITECRKVYTLNEYHHIEPLSQEFGIGWYWDDMSGKEYTDEEIREAVTRADNIQKYGAQVKAERQAEEARQEAARKAEERQKMAFWLHKLTKCEPVTAKDWKEQGKQEQKRKNVMKKNVRTILNHYFPGVKFTVKDSGSSYGASSSITWEDGPTVAEVEAVEEITRFTGYYWYFDNTDYSERRGVASWEEWREMFGEFSDENIKFERTTSEATEKAINAALEAMGAEWEGKNYEDQTTAATGSALVDSLQLDKFIKALGEEIRDKEGNYTAVAGAIYKYWTHCDNCQRNADGGSICRVTAYHLANIARKYYRIPKAQQEAKAAEDNAPKFTPRHGKTYRDIIKALGGNVFVLLNDGKAWDELTELSPLEAAEALAKGDAVGLGKPWDYENRRRVSGVNGGGRKTQEKRAAKFAAVGFGVVVTWSSYKDVIFESVNADTLEALRQDAAEVEAQRKEWEQAQQNPQDKPKRAPRYSEPMTTPEAATDGEILAEGDGVQLIATEEGAKLTGNTYDHKAEIKALGARWYRLGVCWTIKADKIADAVALVNSWNTSTPDSEPTNDSEPQSEPQQEQTTEEPQSEPTADAEPVAEPDELTTAAEGVARAFCQLWGSIDTSTTDDTTTEEATQTATEPYNEPQTTDNTTEAQNKPQREKIRFSADDVPDLDELDTTAAEAPQGATAEEVEKTRQYFARYRHWADEATDNNEHTEALKYQAFAMIWNYGETTLKVDNLFNELEAMKQRHEKRGHITPEDRQRRDEIHDELISLCLAEYGEELAAVLFGRGTVKAHINNAA